MTTDIKIRWDNDLFTGDFLFVDNDLDTDEGLGTAVIISLFTDARASDDDPIPNANNDQGYIDKRGWWGDLANPEVEGDQIGSKLWLLERAKTTQENLNKAEDYALQALQWLIDDGIAKEVTVTAERTKIGENEVLALSVEITKVDGNQINYSFDPEWSATLLEDQ